MPNLNAPSKDPDGVPAQGPPGHVLVHPGLVVGEVLEHREGGLHRAVRHQLQLDLANVPLNKAGKLVSTIQHFIGLIFTIFQK